MKTPSATNLTTSATVFFPILLTCSAFLSSACADGLKLGSLFTDHMVLQREQPVPVWGTAMSGAQITVDFSQQKKTTKAGANGQWLVKLDPMPASLEGRELVVSADAEKQRINISDVVVGDVWLGSGQSNMHFTMRRVYRADQEIAAAKHPAIRFFYVNPQFAGNPRLVSKANGKPFRPKPPVNAQRWRITLRAICSRSWVCRSDCS